MSLLVGDNKCVLYKFHAKIDEYLDIFTLILHKSRGEEMQKRKQQANYDSRAYWLCKCDCGNYKTVNSDCLVQGHTVSCGCIHSQGEVLIVNKRGLN